MTRIVGLCGSLRAQSWNRKLLNAFVEALPETATYSEADYADVPHFNADLVAESGTPDPVEALNAQIAAAEAIVIATPEYNYSVPGVLKNAIDWVSRAPEKPFAGKPVLILTASVSALGGVRAQYHLRQILVFLEAHALNRPEIFLSQAPSRFDEAGKLTDPVARDLLAQAGLALTGAVSR